MNSGFDRSAASEEQIFERVNEQHMTEVYYIIRLACEHSAHIS